MPERDRKGDREGGGGCPAEDGEGRRDGRDGRTGASPRFLVRDHHLSLQEQRLAASARLCLPACLPVNPHQPHITFTRMARSDARTQTHARTYERSSCIFEGKKKKQKERSRRGRGREVINKRPIICSVTEHEEKHARWKIIYL